MSASPPPSTTRAPSRRAPFRHPSPDSLRLHSIALLATIDLTDGLTRKPDASIDDLHLAYGVLLRAYSHMAEDALSSALFMFESVRRATLRLACGSAPVPPHLGYLQAEWDPEGCRHVAGGVLEAARMVLQRAAAVLTRTAAAGPGAEGDGDGDGDGGGGDDLDAS